MARIKISEDGSMTKLKMKKRNIINLTINKGMKINKETKIMNKMNKNKDHMMNLMMLTYHLKNSKIKNKVKKMIYKMRINKVMINKIKRTFMEINKMKSFRAKFIRMNKIKMIK